MSDVDRFLAELMEPAFPSEVVEVGPFTDEGEDSPEEDFEETDEEGNPKEYAEGGLISAESEPAKGYVEGGFTSVDECAAEAGTWCMALTHDGKYGCTRAKGHDGVHEAGIGFPGVVATWPVESNHSSAKLVDKKWITSIMTGSTSVTFTLPLPA